MREPKNNADYEAQYEHIIKWLSKAGAPSPILGYAANLYKKALFARRRKEIDKEIEDFEKSGAVLFFNSQDHTA